MIESLISSKTRINLLVKFFINSNNVSYLRGLASEFNESTNSIRIELNRFEKAGLLLTERNRNKKLYRANTSHPLFSEINKIVLKHTGVDTLIQKLILHIGQIEKVFLLGKLASGLNDDAVEIEILGKINRKKLDDLLPRFEHALKRKIVYSIHENSEDWNPPVDGVLIWQKDSME